MRDVLVQSISSAASGPGNSVQPALSTRAISNATSNAEFLQRDHVVVSVLTRTREVHKLNDCFVQTFAAAVSVVKSAESRSSSAKLFPAASVFYILF